MKLRRVALKNVRSFREPAEADFRGDLSILIGPNGGGKTNLLDAVVAVVRRHILPSWTARRTDTPDIRPRYEFEWYRDYDQNVLERHSDRRAEDQLVELDFEVTPTDIEGVRAVRTFAAELGSRADLIYLGAGFPLALDWDLGALTPGQTHTFRLVNGDLEQPRDPSAQTFLSYLQRFEAFNFAMRDLESPLRVPMLSLPATRGSAAMQTVVSLAGHDDATFKRGVDVATSRSPGSVGTLAIGRLASLYRMLQEEDKGNTKRRFTELPQVQQLTKTMRSMGYGWELECTNPLTNEYVVQLHKGGTSFRLQSASSGEKELLTFFFGLLALDVRNALVVVDEPELHLHPKWQQKVLEMLGTLSRDTGNQFVLATHSPVFVSPASIQHVSRVYSQEQQSRIVTLDSRALPSAKHLLGIVNSHNNERMFFADKVVLVEGLSDRIFFSAVFRRLGSFDDSGSTLEIVSVGGKSLFNSYYKILDAARVRHITIADLDYVNQVAGDDIRGLFRVDPAKVLETVRDPASKDGQSFAARLDEALRSGATEDLKQVVEYIRGRHRRLRTDLTQDECARLDKFIGQQRDDNVHILRRGTLEDYLPMGYRTKDLNLLVTLLESDFWSSLTLDVQEELQLIAKSVAAA